MGRPRELGGGVRARREKKIPNRVARGARLGNCRGESHPDHSHSPMGTRASGFPAVASAPGTEQVLGRCLCVRRIKNRTYKGMDGGALGGFAVHRGEGVSLPLLCH